MEEQDQSNFEELKKEIDQIRNEYRKAKQLLDNVQNISRSFDDLKIKTDTVSNEILSSYENIKPKKQEVEDIRNGAQNQLNEISANLEKVKGNISSMQESYTQFSEIKGKIDGRSGEIENLLQSATGLKNDIETTKNEAQKVLEDMRNSFAEVQKKIQEMQTAYEKFLEIKGKIDDEKTGLTAVFNSIQDFKSKTEAIYKEIQSFRDESKQLLENIKKNKDDSENLKNEIDANLKESRESKDEISKIADLITDTGFANAFQSRAKKLFIGYCIWGGVLIGSVVGLIILLYLYFHNQDGEIPKLEYIAYRLTLSSPLLFLIGFAVAQYSKERDLNEKYEFKATTATVIRNHIKFLIDNHQLNNDGINNFSSGIFTKLYNEPYDNGKLEERVLKLENSSKRERKNFKEITGSIKELQTLIPNEDLLKEVISLINRHL